MTRAERAVAVARKRHRAAVERAAERREEAILKVDEVYRSRCERADEALREALATIAAVEDP